jgi:choline monooxygenase
MNLPLSRKITRDQLAAIDLPIETATGLPNAAYTDGEFFTFERDYVLGTSWSALAFCADYPDSDGVWPLEFMGLPLVITRTKQGELKVFHNVCSHRGRRLVNEQKATNGTIVCPYHCWTYDLEGKLRATPHIGGFGIHKVDGFCRERHGLKEISSHSWLGVLFVNLSGNAPEFGQYAADLVNRYSGYISDEGMQNIRFAKNHGRIQFDIQCNWKLAMENFMEAYHLPWIHPGLNEYSPLDKHHNMFINENFAGQRSTSFNPEIAGCESFPRFHSWPEEQAGCAEYPAFYPNLMLGFQENHIFVLIVKPEDIDRTHEDVRLAYINEDAATGDRFELARAANKSTWEKVFSEDVTSVEGMQQGRMSPGYTGGAFSPVQDTPTLHFHQWVAKRYLAGYRSLDLG